jgi:hypothetical protein
MTTLVISQEQPHEQTNAREARLHIKVHIDTEVVGAEMARRAATRWLVWEVGNLLRAENPELLITDKLVWRCDVYVTWPDLSRPGYGTRKRVGVIYVDAQTGEPVISDTLIEELQAQAHALAPG